jgi:hypothetical protein
MNYRSRLYAFALVLCSTTFIGAQPRAQVKLIEPSSSTIGQTEELVYEGEFSKALLRGINVAELRFTVNREPAAATSANAGTQNQRAANLHLTMEAVSKGILRKLFGLNFRQRFDSTIEPTSFAVLQTNKIDEQGKRHRISEAVFDRNAGKVVWTERDPNDPNRPPRVVTNQLSGAVQDIATAFYYLRQQPLALGQSFEMLISDSGQVYRTPVRVTQRKKMKTVVGEVWALRVEPEVFGEGRMLRGKGKMSIWYTDDERRLPVKAQINNELGTLDIKLKKVLKDKLQ